MYHLWRKTAAVFLFSSLLALPAFAAEKAVSADVAEVAAVEVTGSRLAESTADVPAQTYVITREDIDNSAARDVQDVLSRVPGVNGLLNSASMAQDKSSVLVRGLATEVLLLVDGVPYLGTNYMSGSNPFDLRSISLTDVDRIEVVKGAGSAIYGSNAAGGVINIITRKPSDKTTGSITLEGGNKEWFRGNVHGTVVLSDDLKVFAGYTRTQEGETKTRLANPATGLYDYAKDYRGNDYYFGFAKGPWAFKAELGDSKSEWDYSSQGYNSDVWSTERDRQKNEYKRFMLNYADGVNTGRLYYYDNKRDVTDPYATTNYRDKVFGATYNRKQEIGTTPFVFGMDFRHENGNISASNSIDDLYDKSRNEYAPYIETSVPIGDAAFDIGLRYEHWDIEDGDDANEFIPRFSLNWANRDGLLYYVTAGRYFSMPSFYQIFGDSRYSVHSNPNLKPEKGWTYDIGVKDDKAKNPWNFGVFYMDMKDKINYETTDFVTYEGHYINVDEYRAWGFEGQYKWNFHENWSYTQGLSYLHAEEKTGSSDWTRSNMPRWDISGILNFKKDPWNAELSAHYYGDRQLTNAVYDDEDIFIVNAAVSWKVDRTTIKLACVNLFDKEFYLNNNGYINPERRFILSATYEF